MVKATFCQRQLEAEFIIQLVFLCRKRRGFKIASSKNSSLPPPPRDWALTSPRKLQLGLSGKTDQVYWAGFFLPLNTRSRTCESRYIWYTNIALAAISAATWVLANNSPSFKMDSALAGVKWRRLCLRKSSSWMIKILPACFLLSETIFGRL